MIYIEPTPYLLALVRRIMSCADAPVDVLFIGANISQPWDLSLDGIPASYLPHGTIAACRAIARKLYSAKYSVMHLAGWGHPVLLGAMIVARFIGIPLAVETDTAIPITQPWFKRVAKRLLYPILFRLPAVFLPGGTRQERYLQHYGVPENRIVVARITVDVAAIAKAVMAIPPEARRARRTKLGIASDECVFLFVGRLEPEKGIAVLLEAFALAFAKRGNVRLLIAGDGMLRGMVETAAARSERVHWAGRLTGEALLEAYAAADVLVLPSVFEPWGLVVNEAMAAGLPIIASERVGCVDDLVVDGKPGVVTGADNPVPLAKAMTRLADDAPLRQAMGVAARQRISTGPSRPKRKSSSEPGTERCGHETPLLAVTVSLGRSRVRGTRCYVFQLDLHDRYAMGGRRGARAGTNLDRSRISRSAAGSRLGSYCLCELVRSHLFLVGGARADIAEIRRARARQPRSVRQRPVLGGPTRLGAGAELSVPYPFPGIVRGGVRAGSDRAVGRAHAL